MRTLLLSVGVEVAYDHFKSKQTPPFILFRNTDSTTFKADNKSYWLDNNYIVDLVTDIKDPVIEKQLEALFDANDMPYDKEENFIDNEQIYDITYFV